MGLLTIVYIRTFVSCSYELRKAIVQDVDLGSSDPLVLWSFGPVVIWSCEPVILWCYGPRFFITQKSQNVVMPNGFGAGGRAPRNDHHY